MFKIFRGLRAQLHAMTTRNAGLREQLRIRDAKINLYKGRVEGDARTMRIKDNLIAAQRARLAELSAELEIVRDQRNGYMADLADIQDKVEAINATHRLIPRAIAPKFQTRALMFDLSRVEGLRDG